MVRIYNLKHASNYHNVGEGLPLPKYISQHVVFRQISGRNVQHVHRSKVAVRL